MYTYYTRVYYNLFRIIRFKPVFVLCVAFICGKGVIYPYINKSPFCVRTQYTLRRLFPFSCCIVLLHAFFVLFVVCLVFAFIVLYSLLYCVAFIVLYFVWCKDTFVFAFVPFWCYCVNFTHINIIPFLCCVRTQTKFNCVRTQCVVFGAGI